MNGFSGKLKTGWLAVDILVAQLSDVFRIGLIFFLLQTALRTRATMGLVVPLLAGVLFVAILLPLTTGTDGATQIEAILYGRRRERHPSGGLLALWQVWQRFRR